MIKKSKIRQKKLKVIIGNILFLTVAVYLTYDHVNITRFNAENNLLGHF